MKVYYSRVSSEDQNETRQLKNVSNTEFDYILTDRCSGSIKLYDRPNGSQIRQLINEGKLTHLEIHSIDRLGRNTLDVLSNWQELTEQGIKIVCRNPNITNFKSNGEPDPFSNLLISILTVLASYERKQILERQREGIEIAKLKGKFRGRSIGTTETKETFLNKPRNKEILKYLDKNYPYNIISKTVGCSYSTINKVKNLKMEIENEIKNLI